MGFMIVCDTNQGSFYTFSVNKPGPSHILLHTKEIPTLLIYSPIYLSSKPV